MRCAVKTVFDLFNLVWLMPLAMGCLVLAASGFATLFLHAVGLPTSKIVPDPFLNIMFAAVGWQAAKAVINIMDS